MWVRGLKLNLSINKLILRRSHPMWVRGLKLLVLLLAMTPIASHPMWVRGLKPRWMPYTSNRVLSRTLCGCVD